MPTSEQAEILISGVIPNTYIKCIYFKSKIDYENYSKIGSKYLMDKFNFRINEDYFLSRNKVKFPERREIIG